MLFFASSLVIFDALNSKQNNEKYKSFLWFSINNEQVEWKRFPLKKHKPIHQRLFSFHGNRWIVRCPFLSSVFHFVLSFSFSTFSNVSPFDSISVLFFLDSLFFQYFLCFWHQSLHMTFERESRRKTSIETDQMPIRFCGSFNVNTFVAKLVWKEKNFKTEWSIRSQIIEKSFTQTTIWLCLGNRSKLIILTSAFRTESENILVRCVFYWMWMNFRLCIFINVKSFNESKTMLFYPKNVLPFSPVCLSFCFVYIWTHNLVEQLFWLVFQCNVNRIILWDSLERFVPKNL